LNGKTAPVDKFGSFIDGESARYSPEILTFLEKLRGTHTGCLFLYPESQSRKVAKNTQAQRKGNAIRRKEKKHMNREELKELGLNEKGWLTSERSKIARWTLVRMLSAVGKKRGERGYLGSKCKIYYMNSKN
jgi:hypothetical protein